MILKNAKIVTLKKVIENGYLEIEGKKIKSVKEGPYLGNDEAIDIAGNVIMPGFIDLHIHGSAGYDFIDPDREFSFKDIARHIGNAVPVRLGEVIGQSIINHLGQHNIVI